MALYANPLGAVAPGFSDPSTSRTIRDLFFAGNPELAYRRYLRQLGVEEFSPFGQFAQRQYGNLYADYALASLDREPNFSFTNFLEESGGLDGLRRRFRSLSPDMRGENPGRIAGPVRYLRF